MNDHHKFRIEKLHTYLELIAPLVVRERAAMSDMLLQEPVAPRFDAPTDDGEWQPLDPGGAWGGKQQWAYFRATGTVPASWQGGAVELYLRHDAHYIDLPNENNYPAGPEGQVFIDGQRVSAIDREHHRIRFAATPGQSY